MIILIGPYPPPYGGISVHIKNLTDYMSKKKVDYILYNESISTIGKSKIVSKFQRFNNLKKLIRRHAKVVIHLNTSTGGSFKKFLLVLLLKKRGQKTIFSLHGSNSYWSIKDINNTSLKKRLYFYFLSKFDYIILDNKSQIDILKRYNVTINYSVIPEFIPPPIDDGDYGNIPNHIWDFYKAHKIVIYAMAWITFYNGLDLYGLDMMISLMKGLKERGYASVGLVIKVLGCEPKNQSYYNKMKKQVKDDHLQNDILFIEESLDEIYPLEREADAMIRPSCTDGDSVSVRESLYFNVPVVASDAVTRPEGCIIFKNRDIDDFEKKVIETMNKIKIGNKERIDIPLQENNAEKILEVYKKVLGNK